MSSLRELRLAAKAAIKKRLSPVLFRDPAHPIVIASPGRSASTLLCDSVAESLVRERFPRVRSTFMTRVLTDSAMEFADRLADIPSTRFPVIKTHDFPSQGTLPDGRYIFVFGDPLESAQSVQQIAAVRGARWFERHLYHLRGEGELSDLFDADILNYEAQIAGWLSAPPDNVLLVPFDMLWEYQEEISRFVGFTVALPSRKPRTPKPAADDINEALFDALRARYRQAIDEAESRKV